MSVVDSLARDHRLSGFPRSALSTLVLAGLRRHYAPGDLLYRQGEPARSVHVVLEGRVMLERSHAQLASPVVVEEMDAGTVLGAEDVLETGVRMSDARVRMPTETLEIDAAVVRAVAARWSGEVSQKTSGERPLVPDERSSTG